MKSQRDGKTVLGKHQMTRKEGKLWFQEQRKLTVGMNKKISDGSVYLLFMDSGLVLDRQGKLEVFFYSWKR